MGCSSSKSSVVPSLISPTFPSTRIPLADQHFEKATPLLSEAQSLQQKYQDITLTGRHLSGTFQLQDYNHIETIKVLFWALSAASQGDINRLDVQISAKNTPVFQMNNPIPLAQETEALNKSVMKYLEAITEGPKELPKIISGLNEIVTNLFKMRDQLIALSPKKKVEVYEKNLNKLLIEQKKVKDLYILLKKNLSEFRKSQSKIKRILTRSDLIGAQAHREGLFVPREIFEKYNTNQRKKPPVKKLAFKRKRSEDDVSDDHISIVPPSNSHRFREVEVPQNKVAKSGISEGPKPGGPKLSSAQPAFSRLPIKLDESVEVLKEKEDTIEENNSNKQLDGSNENMKEEVFEDKLSSRSGVEENLNIVSQKTNEANKSETNEHRLSFPRELEREGKPSEENIDDEESPVRPLAQESLANDTVYNHEQEYMSLQAV